MSTPTFNGYATALPAAADLALLGIFNVKNYGAKGDGATDDTVAIQSAINAAYAAGGGLVLLQAGTYIVDLTTSVGSGGSLQTCAIAIPSNVALQGAGIDATTIKLKSVSRSQSSTTYSIVINQNPDTGNSGIMVSNLTIDCNRANQGPWVYQASSASGAITTIRGLSIWAASSVSIPNLRVKNCSDFAVFIEAASSDVKLGFIDTSNCVAGVAFDSAVNSYLDRLVSVNADSAATINTTSTTAITSGTTATASVAATGQVFTTNQVLLVDAGTANAETVVVTAGGTGQFSAYFAKTHSGTWAVNDGLFYSDSAAQVATGASKVSIGSVEVDYSAARAINGSGAEIFGCKTVSIASLNVIGAMRGAWLHNWTVNSVQNILQDVAIGAISVRNSQASFTGVAPIGIYLDDQGYTGITNAVRNITVGAATVRYGYGGASIPANSIGIAFNPNVTNCSIAAMAVDGGNQGLVLNGCFGNTVSGSIANTVTQGVQFQNAAHDNIVHVSVRSPGAQGVQLISGSAITGNYIEAIVRGVPNGFKAIDLSGGGSPSQVANNTIVGDVTGCPSPVFGFAPGVTNVTRIIGLNPVGNIGGGAPTLASGTALVNNTGVDCRVVIAGGTVAQIALNGTNTNLTSGVFFVAQGESITISYSVAPTTYIWFGV